MHHSFIGVGRSFHQPGVVNENVLKSDFEPLCDGITRRRSLADLCLTETWLKPEVYIILNESPPKITVTKMSHVQKAKGEVSLQFQFKDSRIYLSHTQLYRI